MQKVLTVGTMLTVAALAWSAGPVTAPSSTTQAKKAPAKKPAVTAVKKPAGTVASKASPAAKKPASAASVAAARRKKAPATTWRNRQTVPTADRYREIQEALAARGYLPSEQANGTWGPSSSDALSKFQADQTLESTGKINSLSLIALGLGPRHEAASTMPVDGNYPQLESGRN